MPVKARCPVLQTCPEITAVTASTNASSEWKVATVTLLADAALKANLLQFRLRFSKADTDNDAAYDYVGFGASEYTSPADRRPYLTISCEYP